ncbi:[protein release factor]-glutamine N5-methyltransferase [Sulfuritortus calidifontis]|uniref:Release factor glutamine methyltransferase n=1 Tax=Sulfuritortus calidifontis TaxID=1914471 RepID=A0A4R3K0I4_9PROT|nr:peptide chain release factor N(5)-glutamine methyltransferase [Sulfuritortus calidifontis]TCS73235.1 [protein release factor]-glutamine N5-methyltransferase [Sulfuritortus calidifontis]
MSTLDDLLRHGAHGFQHKLGLDPAAARLEAQALAAHALEVTRVWLVAHGRDRLAGELTDKIEALFRRRCAGEPVAYLIGRREFYGREFQVGPSVLIPRPETEHLVEAALTRLLPLSPTPLPKGEGNKISVLDIGTGSGCIAITLKLERPDLSVTAVDVSPTALSLARANAEALHAEIEFIESDLFSALAGRRFELIVSNPPYIPTADEHLSQGDLRFEPKNALASGPDGLDAIRLIIDQAKRHLAPGGWLLFEHGYDQGEAVQALLKTAGYAEVFLEQDLAGQPRVSGGHLL